MKIAGTQRCTLVDWPGKIAAALFTPGCNMDCYYCHNRHLLGAFSDSNCIPTKKIIAWLDKRADLLDGVVITGGEPTMQEDLPDFIRQVRALGLPVKLDTNGTNFRMLSELIDEELLDYVAMDIKAPFDKYHEYTRVPLDLGSISSSIDLLLQDKVDYEFRTTMAPQLTRSDYATITKQIQGAKTYVLQQYRKPETLPACDDPRNNVQPRSPEWIRTVLEMAGQSVGKCKTRGVDLTETHVTKTFTEPQAPELQQTA